MVYCLDLEPHCVRQAAPLGSTVIRKNLLGSALTRNLGSTLTRKLGTRQCSHKKSRQCSQKLSTYHISMRYISIHGWVITTFGFDLPIHRHLHGKLHRRIKFHPNRSTHGGVMTSYRWRHSDTNLLLVKIYVYTKCRWDIPIHGRIITTSGFGKQTPYWNFTSGLKSDYIRHLDMLPVIFEPSLVAEEAQKFFCQSVNQFSRYVNFLIPSFMLENAHFCPFGEVFGNWPLNIVRYCRDPKRHILGRTHAFWRINRHDRSRKCDRGSWRRKRY